MGAQIATSKLILAAVHQSSTDTAAAAAHIGYVPHRARWHLHCRTVVLGTSHAPRPCKYGSISGSGRFGAAMVGSVLILLHHDQLSRATRSTRWVPLLDLRAIASPHRSSDLQANRQLGPPKPKTFLESAQSARRLTALYGGAPAVHRHSNQDGGHCGTKPGGTAAAENLIPGQLWKPHVSSHPSLLSSHPSV